MATSQNRIALNIADEATQNDLVRGFTRGIIQNIPDPIMHLCFLYYQIKELFQSFKGQNDNTIKYNGSTYINSNTGINWVTAYGALKIPSLQIRIHKWKLKVIQPHSSLVIGISETKYVFHKDCFLQNGKYDINRYGVWNSTGKWAVTQKNGFIIDVNNTEFKKGDIVEMVLDLKNTVLSFSVNGKDFEVAFDDIEVGDEIDYCLAVSSLERGSGILILEYSQILV